MKRKTMERLAPWVVAVIILLLWEATVHVFQIEKVVLPTASDSFIAMWEYREAMIVNALPTLAATSAFFRPSKSARISASSFLS